MTNNKLDNNAKNILINELHEINLRIIKNKINVHNDIYNCLVIRRKQIIQLIGW